MTTKEVYGLQNYLQTESNKLGNYSVSIMIRILQFFVGCSYSQDESIAKLRNEFGPYAAYTSIEALTSNIFENNVKLIRIHLEVLRQLGIIKAICDSDLEEVDLKTIEDSRGILFTLNDEMIQSHQGSTSFRKGSSDFGHFMTRFNNRSVVKTTALDDIIDVPF